VAEEVEHPKTPAAFLATLAATLKTSEGCDGELADVLTAHILTTSPDANALASAKSAIMKLAESRAAPKACEAVDG
jgi:hypothetical protein